MPVNQEWCVHSFCRIHSLATSLLMYSPTCFYVHDCLDFWGGPNSFHESFSSSFACQDLEFHWEIILVKYFWRFCNFNVCSWHTNNTLEVFSHHLPKNFFIISLFIRSLSFRFSICDVAAMCFHSWCQVLRDFFGLSLIEYYISSDCQSSFESWMRSTFKKL